MASYLSRYTRTTLDEIETELNRLQAEGYVICNLFGEGDWAKTGGYAKATIHYADAPFSFNYMGVVSPPSGTPVDVWPGPTDRVPLPDSPVSLEVVSKDVNDTLAGTGARQVQLTLLAADYASTTVVVDMNGTTPVPVAGSWLRINPSFVVTAGSNESPVGEITIQQSSGTVYDIIPPGNNHSYRAVATVPKDRWITLDDWSIKILADKQNDYLSSSIQARPPGGVWALLDYSGQLDPENINYFRSLGHRLSPGTDVRIETTAGASNMSVSAVFSSSEK